jgi:hypothetical protein
MFSYKTSEQTNSVLMRLAEQLAKVKPVTFFLTNSYAVYPPRAATKRRKRQDEAFAAFFLFFFAIATFTQTWKRIRR